MSLSPRKHDKLNNPKHAAVSLDSFLGLLSSAYGTEQLDSSIIFEKDSVNWSNISVENLNAISRKDDTGEKVKKEKSKEFIKVNAATSTTNLRPKNSNEDEIDETLVSIKSLVSLQQIKSKLDLPNSEQQCNPEQEEESNHSPETDLGEITDKDHLEMEDPKAIGDNVTNLQTCLPPVCGFYVDDINHKVVFDIQFVKKTFQDDEIMPMFQIGEPEISISINDISKPMKSSAKVPKCNLVSKVNYFADVEKEFGLENLDVIVRCNIGVFQWVLQWLMSDIPMCRPSLNVINLKSILSMANHLGINQLVEECLDFFIKNLQLVLDTDREIEDVFDDALLLELTKRFPNSAVEQMNNNFDSFKAKLFCSLIKLLADPEPNQKIGHFSSLSTMFQCGFCQKTMHVHLMDDVPCRADCTRLTFDGKLKYKHECSNSWNLSRFIESMYEEFKDWRLVYWQLWGMSHFFFCEICQTWYPLSQSDWCPYHPSEVEYFPMKNGLQYPIGTYGCCGEKAFKFDTIKPNFGCRYKSHVSKLDTLEKVEQFNIQQEFKQVINTPCPNDLKVKKFVKLVKNDDFSTTRSEIPVERFWWNGLLLAPEEKRDYSLIPMQVLNILRNRPEEKKFPKIHLPLKLVHQVPLGCMVTVKDKTENDSIGESSTSSIQASKKVKPKFGVKKGKSSNVAFGPRNKSKKKKSLAYVYQPTESVWSDLESNKDNQDNQRDFEEIAMRKLVQMLTPTAGTSASQASSAGSYIRLESEWWQRNCASHMDKTSSTVVNRTFPLSWFRRLTI